MPGALVKIRSGYDALPVAEKHVADYILDNSEEVPFYSVSNLANACGVSIASVSRLSKKMGYGNFKDFKIDIAQEVSAQNGVSSIYEAITPNDTSDTIIEKVFFGNVRSLEDTLTLLDKAAMNKVAGIVLRANRLLFFGVGSSGNVARDAALRFTHIGIHAYAYTDSFETLIQAVTMEKGDVAFGISHSGRSVTTLEALKLARKDGIFTIGISNYPQSSLSKVSDIFFCTSFPESRVQASALSSRLSQLCLLDTLYALAARKQESAKSIQTVNTMAEKFLRIKDRKYRS